MYITMYFTMFYHYVDHYVYVQDILRVSRFPRLEDMELHRTRRPYQQFQMFGVQSQ